MSDSSVKELYLIIDNDGVLRERSAGDMTKAETIKDILNGQFDNVAFIYCICAAEGTCRDVTEDMAREILDKHELLSASARDFIEQVLGCATLAQIEREDAQQAAGWTRQTYSTRTA